MKKPISVLLILAMVLAMSTAAFAATIDSAPGSQNIDVNARYEDGTTASTTYSVDVAWGAMEFTYTISGTKEWDPVTHTYTTNTTPTWSGSGNEITVTNHSNAGITASFAFSALDAYNTVTGAFSAASVPLPSAEGKETTDPALTGKSTLTLSGTLEDTVTTMTKVGSVTVTIS